MLKIRGDRAYEHGQKQCDTFAIEFFSFYGNWQYFRVTLIFPPEILHVHRKHESVDTKLF